MNLKHTLVTAFILMTAVFAVAQSPTGAQQTTNTAVKSGAGTAATSTTSPVRPDPAPLEPAASGEPHTEMLDTANGPASLDPLLEPRPLPRADLSPIGGIVRRVDTVHNRLTLQPFGGGNRYSIYFDERTRILRGGRETTALGIHPGDRAYVDTQSLGAQVFARTIQVRTTNGPAQASGQVIEILGGQVRLQDRMSGQTIRFLISDRTKVESRSGPASAGDLHSGSLVDVTFTSAGHQSEAQNITIFATPGESYIFAGILTHVDLRDGVFALDNQVDGNNYELYFDPLEEKNVGRMVVGAPVSVTASFDGKRYRATSIRITEGADNSDSSDR
jgi:hypothetical protein